MADFDNRSIDGVFTGTEIRHPEADPVDWDAEIRIKEATIADSGFKAELEGQRGVPGFRGTATGQFFGPDAAEVGGVISAEDEDRVYDGYFGGKKTQ